VARLLRAALVLALAAAPAAAFEDALRAHGGFWNWRAYRTMRCDVTGWPFCRAASGRDHLTIDLPTHRVRVDSDGPPVDARPPYAAGFDGRQAWVRPSPDAIGAPARFYTEAPFQFIGMPFVLAEAGVEEQDLGDRWVNGRWFEAYRFVDTRGADTPSDTFVAYIDMDTHLLRYAVYEVTWPGLAVHGRRPARQAVEFDEWQEADGLMVPKRISICDWTNGRPGDERAAFTVDDVHFDRAAAAPAAFAPPAGAAVSPGL
jgi:hypothetical protein